MSDRRSGPGRPSVGASGSLRERAIEWMLIDGRRSHVTALVAALFSGFFATLTLTGLVPLLDVQALFYVYSGFIAGNVTLVTVVVSINQLLLSRELQTPGELREQIDEVIDYRSQIEDVTGQIAPVEPLGFLELLVEATREEAQRLGGLARNAGGSMGEETIDDQVERLTEQMDVLDGLLEESGEDTIGVLSVLLETNYARDINQLRRLKARHREEIDEAVADAVDDLIERLQEIDVARQYFKTIYLQQELSRFSRLLLYVGGPAVAAAVASLLALTVPGGMVDAAPEPRILLPVTLAIATLPLAVLCAYSVRVATVTNLTAATLPFTTPEQER